MMKKERDSRNITVSMNHKQVTASSDLRRVGPQQAEIEMVCLLVTTSTTADFKKIKK